MPKNIRRFPKVMSEDDLAKMLETIATSKSYAKRGAGKFIRLRDAALQLFLYHTGLRPGEALNLRWVDIDFERRIISIDPFSNKERNGMNAVLTLPALRYLQIYKEEMAKMEINSEFLFPSLWTWKPMTVDGMGKRFREIVKEAGLLKIEFYRTNGNPKYTYSMYTHRRSFGTKVYNETEDMVGVMKLLRLFRPTSIPSYVIYSDEKRKAIADSIWKDPLNSSS